MKYLRIVIYLLILSGSIIYSQNFKDMQYMIADEYEYAPLPDNDSVYGIYTILQPLPQYRYGVNSYYIQEFNKVFICGGADENSTKTECYMYDPAANSYQVMDPLPMGRTLGKLVRVQNSLYLIGSVGNSFALADGIIYEYKIFTNEWSVKDTMPAPFLHESAVAVYRDSTILMIGGSTSLYSGATNLVRFYKPLADTFITATMGYPFNFTTAHAEVHPVNNNVFVMGGAGTTFYNFVYMGTVDTITNNISWINMGPTPYGVGVYRVGGGRWNNLLLFGPALWISTSYPHVWALDFISVDTLKWTKFLPGIPSNASNRPTLAVDQSTDSIRFYSFGGLNYPAILDSSEKYTTSLPVLLGIKKISNHIPDKIFLYQNYPNPFNPETLIMFSIAGGISTNNIKLKVFDITGREVETLVNDELNSGTYEVKFSGINYSSGIYFYSLFVNGNVFNTNKMLLLK